MLARTPRHPADTLTLIAMIYPTLGAWMYFVLLRDSEWARFLYMGSKLLQFSLPLMWVAIVGARRPRLGLTGPRPAGALAGLLSGLVVSAVLVLCVRFSVVGTELAAEAGERIRETLAVFKVSSPLSYLGVALALSLAHSLLEEYYWRWFVFQRTVAWMPRALAVLVASTAFASHHLIVLNRYAPEASFWTLIVPGTVAVGIGGMIWCWLFARSRSLLAPWLSHVLVDATLMGMGYALLWGPWATGP